MVELRALLEQLFAMTLQSVLLEDIGTVLKRSLLDASLCQHCGLLGCQALPTPPSETGGKRRAPDASSVASSSFIASLDIACPLCQRRMASCKFAQHLEQKCTETAMPSNSAAAAASQPVPSSAPASARSSPANPRKRRK